MVCVLDSGMCRPMAPMNNMAEPTPCAAAPCRGSIRTSRNPSVYEMRQPPKSAPTASRIAAKTCTQSGICSPEA